MPERRWQTVGASHPVAVRYGLGALLAFGALNAFGGGYYGLSGAEGVPTEWLAGSPFSSYFIPSLVLLVAVGGSFLVAAVAVFAGRPKARVLALGAGALVLVWLAVQMSIIGYVSWMQPTTAIAAAVILVLASMLRNPGAR
jgi:hypothetical protein